MSKRFLAIHSFLEKCVLYGFGAVCILSILTLFLPIVSYVLATVLLLLLVATAVCFGMTMIWLVHWFNEQIDILLKANEKFIKDNLGSH
jgi:hypothetical protein